MLLGADNLHELEFRETPSIWILVSQPVADITD